MDELFDRSATFTIQQQLNPTPEQFELLRESLSSFNRSHIPDKGYVPLLFTLTDGAGSFAGGLSGYISYGWLFVDLLWVAQPARDRGQGRKLLLAAEDAARKHGCQHAWLDTFSFQARRFYEKAGYVIFSELEDYPPGHSRYFLRKALL